MTFVIGEDFVNAVKKIYTNLYTPQSSAPEWDTGYDIVIKYIVDFIFRLVSPPISISTNTISELESILKFIQTSYPVNPPDYHNIHRINLWNWWGTPPSREWCDSVYIQTIIPQNGIINLRIDRTNITFSRSGYNNDISSSIVHDVISMLQYGYQYDYYNRVGKMLIERDFRNVFENYLKENIDILILNEL